MQLRHALSDASVGTIIFTTDYSAGQQFSDYSGPYKEETPVLVINRNVTLTGLPGQQPLLDFDFNLSVLELCNTCTFTIEDMAIANDRRGADAQLDFFLGRGGSVLNLTNVIRKRVSCTSIEPALRLVHNTQRSPRFPARNGSKEQVYGAQDITFRGKVYPRTLHLKDYSVEFPRHYNGGYSLVLYNVYRMCDNFVDDSCLESRAADQCVYEHIMQLVQGKPGSKAGSSSAAAAALSAGAIAGIAVAAAAVAASIAALVLLLVIRRRRANSVPAVYACSNSFKDPEAAAAAAAGGKSVGAPGSLDSISPNDSSTAGTSRICAVVSTAPAPEGALQRTTSSSSAAAALEPAPGVVAAAYDLQFGVLLGSGSFGRVYRAKWRERDVAVKVIEHDSRMAAAVANEVQLMLSCNHPNVTPRGSSTEGGRLAPVGFGPCDLAEDNQWENVKTWLIQEFCDSGTLAKASGAWQPANEDDAQMLKRLVLLQDVAQGLRYLHSRNVVHGDLNARNVLITSSSSSLGGYSAKLADLGLSRTIKQHTTHHTTCTVGTMSHMPPELLRYGRMSTTVDIYSFGVMMWEMYCREVAFRELHYGQFFEYVVLRDLRPKVPPSMPEDYRLLMERCWSTNPADRPSSKMVCECLALMLTDRQQALGLSSVEHSSASYGSSGQHMLPLDTTGAAIRR
ncbi:hypothetical protein OEZ85_013348 [Tetradesmus obliquus]|uniref:Protein kinase domain-containing protein n=1 Tax=Tetradesmus obliquus TaxID=3088 RepID=A0ABY8U5P9_TETOB|nr:hypothetical protein OEZ85_013348 [Tetradesmus obliquus]